MGRTGNVDGNQFRLNHERYSNTTTSIFNGFTDLVHANKYEIVTPKDYEVQEGDKIVRLGKTVEQYGQSELTFGKVYEVVRWHEDGELVYKNDMTTALLASYLKEEDSTWGVIPSYENVKEEEGMDDKNEHSKDTRTFKVGDRVRVAGTVGVYEGREGAVGVFDDTGGEPSCAVVFDDGRGKWFESEFLEFVEEEEEMNGKGECVGKFKRGDRVRVTGGYYKGWEGSIDRSAKVGGEHSCSVSFGGRHGFRWVEEELLELVEKVEKSPEQEALEYLLSREKNATRRILREEVAIWAKIHLEHGDYDDLRQATEILEKLEKGE